MAFLFLGVGFVPDEYLVKIMVRHKISPVSIFLFFNTISWLILCLFFRLKSCQKLIS